MAANCIKTHQARLLLLLCRQPGTWSKSDVAFMASLATLAVSVALSFLRVRQGASAAGGAPARPPTEASRPSINGAPPLGKRQLWTLTLTAADAVHNAELPGMPCLATAIA